VSRSTSEHQTALVLLDNASLPGPLRVTDPRSVLLANICHEPL